MAVVVKAKKIKDLPVVTTFGESDLFVIEQVGSNTTTTSTVAGNNLRKGMCRGPYTNDAAAGAAGVSIGEMYYLPSGAVQVRLT